jgi:thiamine biosynthesis lipoprotein
MTDALSTSVFVMGVDEGLTLIACLPEYESIVIDADSQIYYSTGLENPEGGGEGAGDDTAPAPGTC